MEAPEEVMLDLNKLAEGQKFLSLGAATVSDDGNWLAYSTDTTGYRQYTLKVKNLRTGKTLAENIERTGSVVWANDNKTLFYTTEDAVSKRSDKFWRHTAGTDKSDLLYEEKDENFDVGAGRSLDRKIIFVAAYAKTSREYPVSARRRSVRRAQARARPRAGARVRRRPLQRRVLHHHQSRREELPRRQGAGRRSVREELAAVHRPQSRDQDRRPDVLRRAPRRLRARGRAQLPADRRHEVQGVAPHHDRRTRLRDVARHQPRVQHDHDPLRLPVDGDAELGVRIRPEHARPEAVEAAAGARRLRREEL